MKGCSRIYRSRISIDAGCSPDDDKPYDRFVIEQFAGDDRSGISRPHISCARCHDRKIDRLTQQDYYALFASLCEANADQRISRGDNNEPTAWATSYELGAAMR